MQYDGKDDPPPTGVLDDDPPNEKDERELNMDSASVLPLEWSCCGYRYDGSVGVGRGESRSSSSGSRSDVDTI